MTNISGVILNTNYLTNSNNKTTSQPAFKSKEESDIFTSQNKTEKKGNGRKILAGLGIAAAAVGAGYMIFKGKGKKALEAGKKMLGNTGEDIAKVAKGKADDVAQATAAKLSDVKFDKGIAKKGEELFTGTIDDTLKSGKKVTLEYKDGKIMKSTAGDTVKMYGIGDTENSIGLIDIFKKQGDELTKIKQIDKLQYDAGEFMYDIYKINNGKCEARTVIFFDKGKKVSIEANNRYKQYAINNQGKFEKVAERALKNT